MEQTEKNLINIHDKAEEAGIKEPVKIEDGLLKTITPNPFLQSLGVSLDERIENLFGLVKANLNDKSGGEKKTRYYIPFMVLKGPLVKEGYLAVIAQIEKSADGGEVINLTAAKNEDFENEQTF